MSQRRRRIWSEHVSFEALRRPGILRLLSTRSIQLIVAVQPPDLHELHPLLEACGAASVEIGLWPLLDDCLGRWPSDVNVEAYRSHLLRLFETIDRFEGQPKEIVFDLEPPIATTRGLFESRKSERRALKKGDWKDRLRRPPANLEMASRRFKALVNEVRSIGLKPTAVVAPMVVYDAQMGGWQRVMGTPVDSIGFDRITVMAYTPLFEAYSRGVLTRRDARALLGALGRRARDRWHEKAAIALGVVGGGALGNEVPYRSPAELEDDVAIARATGVDDLALFGFSGVLSREPSPEVWLDAFIDTKSAESLPKYTPRSRFLELCLSAAGRVLK